MIERLVAVIRQRNYSIRSGEAYRSWTRRFLTFIGDRDPGDVGAAEVAAFLATLVVQGHVAPSTQHQALNALVFVSGQVLEQPLGDGGTFQRAKRPRRLPVVLTRGFCRPRGFRPDHHRTKPGQRTGSACRDQGR